MAKRPRESDSLEAGTESLDNPNKRVLLKHDGGGDEELEHAAAATATATDADAQLANYQMDEYSPEPLEKSAQAKAAEEVEVVGQANGMLKEKSKQLATAPATAATAAAAARERIAKRKRRNQEDDTYASADPSRPLRADIRRDRRTHQFPVLGFPSVGDEAAEDYDEEALAYLNSVRVEEASIPQVLVGPQPIPGEVNEFEDYEDEYYEEYEEYPNAFYDNDDAIIAAPEEAEIEDDDPNPQELYTRALRDRFLGQRKQLKVPPSAESLAALGDGCPISFIKDNNKSVADWHSILTSKVPQPAQVRAMDQQTVFDLLGLIQRFFLLKNRNIKTKTSAWIWSLLARLDDVGNMDNDQVYLVRCLGQKSLIASVHIDNPEGAMFLETGGQPQPQVPKTKDPNEIDLEEDDRPKSSSSKDSNSSKTNKQPSKDMPASQYTDNTKATLEMITTVVGDVFRQRDILLGRLPWEKKEETTTKKKP